MIAILISLINELGNLIFRAQLADDLVKLLADDVHGLATVIKAPDGCELQIGVRAIRGSDMVMRALANEFGTRTIPERSFLRATVDRNRLMYLDMLQDALDRSLSGDDLVVELERIGTVVVGDVQRYMTELKYPPNAPSTIRRKGSANPLIDTGQLRQSIDYVVLCNGEPVPSTHPVRALGKVLRANVEQHGSIGRA